MPFYLYLFCYLFPLFDAFSAPNAPLFRINEELNQGVGNECRCADSLVLVTFYEAMKGAEWTDSWNLSDSINTWQGITLNNGGCVSGITLNTNNLVGELPDEIGDLAGLKSLSLGNNEITGSLPESLGALSRLESLNLRNNQLSGIIPTALAALSKLATLNLSVNELSGTIPTQIGNIRTLTGVFLNQNNLTGNIPIQLGNLVDLVSLNLAGNQLTGLIPNEIGLLSKLVGIGLNDNQLTGELPLEFGFLEKLVSLRLENNQLTGEIPETYGDLPKLESIALNDNNLSGCFPENLINLCELGEIAVQFGTGYNFRNNPLLPWEGDFNQFCEGNDQTRATCNDGNVNTVVDGINENCQCGRFEPVVEPEIMLNVELNTIGTCPEENNGQLNVFIQPSSDNYLINWTAPNGTQMEGQTSATFELAALAMGNYSLTIRNETDTSLVLTQIFEIETINCSGEIDETKIPRLITPNGDGLNEQFIFDDLANNPTLFEKNEIIIFNRWGDVVFQAKPYQNDWYGQNNTGGVLPQGTYYYMFKLDLNEGKVIKADITIVR
ncbi:MAG: gliding motility-associated C-terminal domain-containing protein [Saprospiraceae bacterium]